LRHWIASLSLSSGGHSPDPLARNDDLLGYFFALRFFALFRFFAAAFFFEAFFGTFLPAALASERPIAIACLRLFTFRPERPLFNVPALRFFITRSTSAEAFLEYFRAMMISPGGRELIFAPDKSSECETGSL
jgi:hypothetical protein